LSRQKVEKRVGEKAKEEQAPSYVPKAEWNILENTGRRYAKVSGDFNLIHIHAITAKAFGFKQAIAHGMWSKA
ncbi:MaoC/PaaZ C-terminal domain-containing protein, partial [Acinetobacter bereziniae]